IEKGAVYGRTRRSTSLHFLHSKGVESCKMCVLIRAICIFCPNRAHCSAIYTKSGVQLHNELFRFLLVKYGGTLCLTYTISPSMILRLTPILLILLKSQPVRVPQR